MQLDTRYFGQVTVDPSEFLHFSNGLFGFETESSFLLIPFDGEEGTLLCLQSTQTPSLAFTLMHPFRLKPDYAPVLTPAELEALAVTDSEALCYYVMCTVRQPVQDSTINLRCPIAINGETKQAMQVILDIPEYQMRHPLSAFEKAGGLC